MASQRAVEIKVGLFVIIASLIGAVVIFLIGSANQQFDKSVALYTSFSSVSGLQMGSQVRLSGLKIGVVERVWIVSKQFDLTQALREWELHKQREAALQQGLRLAAEPALKTQAPRSGCQPPPLPSRKLIRYARLKKVSPSKVPRQLTVSFICVRMKVLGSSLQHIRTIDSVAMVKGKGLLGDSLIEISMGVKGPAVTEDGFVRGLTPKGLSDFLAEGGEVVTKLKRSLAHVEDLLSQYSDPTLSNNLKGIISSINHIIGRVKTGPGLLHDLFYAKNLTRNVHRVVYQFQRLTASLANTINQLNWIMRRAKRKGTLVHSLLIARTNGDFAQKLKLLISSTRRAVDALRQLLQAPQKPGTFLHKILYEKDTAKIIVDLQRASSKLSQMMARINKGKGTLGALINDPTAFEDFKAILGQVKRSRVFKALIRFVIKRDDQVKGGRVISNP